MGHVRYGWLLRCWDRRRVPDQQRRHLSVTLCCCSAVVWDFDTLDRVAVDGCNDRVSLVAEDDGGIAFVNLLKTGIDERRGFGFPIVDVLDISEHRFDGSLGLVLR